jgi:hypothetical protein
MDSIVLSCLFQLPGIRYCIHARTRRDHNSPLKMQALHGPLRSHHVASSSRSHHVSCCPARTGSNATGGGWRSTHTAAACCALAACCAAPLTAPCQATTARPPKQQAHRHRPHRSLTAAAAGPSPGGDAPAAAGPTSSSSTLLPAAFRALTATSVVFGAAALLAPAPLVELVTGAGALPVDVVFTRIAGGTMAISAAVEWSLAVRADWFFVGEGWGVKGRGRVRVHVLRVEVVVVKIVRPNAAGCIRPQGQQGSTAVD